MEKENAILKASQEAMTDAFVASENKDTQAMVAWVARSCWSSPGTTFFNAASCCFEDAREGDLNGATRGNVSRWRKKFDAAKEKYGVTAALAAVAAAKRRQRQADAMAADAEFCRIAGETPEAFKKRLHDSLSIIERGEVGENAIFARVENGKIVAGFTLHNDTSYFAQRDGRWVVKTDTRDYSSHEYHFAD